MGEDKKIKIAGRCLDVPTRARGLFFNRFSNCNSRLLSIVIKAAAIFLLPMYMSLARADSYNDFMLLAFPDEPPVELRHALTFLNSKGIVRLTRKTKVCVLGPDVAARAIVDGLLNDILSDFPEVARSMIDRNCNGITIEDTNQLDIPIWISRSPWPDLRAHLLPYLNQSSASSFQVEAIVKQYEQADPNDLPSISVLQNGTVRGLLILKQLDAEQLIGTLFGYTFMILNPKSSVAKYNPPLAFSSDAGRLKSLKSTKDYLRLLYSDVVHQGDSKEKFGEAVKACIAAGAC